MADPATIHRLTDIDTEEVSIVDLAANARKFLVVKGASMSKAGTQVVADGKGGHTVAKDTPPPAPGAPPAPAAAPPAAPAASAPPAATPAPPGPAAEPVLQLSPEAKAELLKRVERATERLSALKALVDGASEVPGLVEVPSDIATKVAELLTGLAQGDVEKGAQVSKGLPQFSTARTAQLQAAYDALGAVLGSVAKPEPAPTPDPAVPAEGEVAKEIAKALAPLESKVAGALDKITTLVSKHDEAIAKQASTVADIAKSRPTPRSSSPEGTREAVDKGYDDDESNGWPSDMAHPDKHDVKKVNPEVRFTKR